jgi:two-component sensor histidine kinase
MGQLFFDITERKRAEVRQAELFDELNHRVKNNLMLVSGILQMKARGTDNDVVRDELLRAVARVEGIAHVHTALYKGARKDAVDFGAYLKELCAGLSRSLIHEERLSLDVEAESIMVGVDDAIPLGMVANELVTNAVKYAYPPPGEGSISVRFCREEGGLLLVVSDQGCGLPATGEDRSGGLGMKLVASLIAQVNGCLSIARHAGTTFEVRLPLELAVVPRRPLPN